MTNLFTYGTLQIPEVWRSVAGCEFASLDSQVADFAVYRFREFDFPGMIAEQGGSATGTIYLDIDVTTLQRIDHYEGDFYSRETIQVVCEGGQQRSCQVYLLTAKYSDQLSDQPWTVESYLATGGLERFLQQ